jgi:hypothetical protein
MALWGTVLLSLPLNVVSSGEGLTEGQAVACEDKPGENRVYRYTQGKRRWYPGPIVADSWDPSWGQNIVMISCNKVPEGPEMKFNQPPIPEGSTIKCRNGDKLFRYENEQRRWYENPSIAESWDPNYKAATREVECITIPEGPDMPFNPSKIPEGHAIKCSSDDPHVYRYSKGNRHLYPGPSIASSWDPNWGNFFVTNCANIPQGMDIKFNQDLIPEGQSIRCRSNTAILYRYTNGERREYPDERTAKSWEQDAWSNVRTVECISIPEGSRMLYNPESLNEGQTIRCADVESRSSGVKKYFQYTHGERRLYPNTNILQSYDPNYETSSVLSDCFIIPRGEDMR